MTPAEILARFDAEMRIDPPPAPGVRYERVGSIVRGFGAWNAVVFARLTAGDADAVIAEQVAVFRSVAIDPGRGNTYTGVADGNAGAADARAIEWKVYGHDLPADLGARLAAAGFEPDEPETLMVFDLGGELRDHARPGAAAPAVDVRRVTDAAGLADAMAATGAAFERDETWRAARIYEFGPRLADPAFALYVVYADGRPVASARTEFPPQRSFAGLWGGGTVPEYRGRGIYRTLVHVRASEARRRGYRYLRVDARMTSRPILERLGFIALTGITEWRFPLSAAHST